jgi:hypothetical protein
MTNGGGSISRMDKCRSGRSEMLRLALRNDCDHMADVRYQHLADDRISSRTSASATAHGAAPLSQRPGGATVGVSTRRGGEAEVTFDGIGGETALAADEQRESRSIMSRPPNAEVRDTSGGATTAIVG